ncbi:MAG: tetratricopeptide repeat protein [Myxococcales bacterium]
MTALDEARRILAEGGDPEPVLDRAAAGASPLERPRVVNEAARLLHKAGRAEAAARWYGRAADLSPRDPEPRHDRGLALLEAGEVGLAAFAQREALALDPDHTGARAQLAAALEALGDDDGAARELAELLARIGPQPALSARLSGLRDAARRAAHRSLLGSQVSRLGANALLSSAFVRGSDGVYRAPFAELYATGDSQGRVERLALVFGSMDASLGRTDLSYGGTTEDDHGRRVPLDEFSAASTVFLAQGLGIDPDRARRLLRFLLTKECGLGPHRFAGAQVGWVIEDGAAGRRYGLFVGRRLGANDR